MQLNIPFNIPYKKESLQFIQILMYTMSYFVSIKHESIVKHKKYVITF